MTGPAAKPVPADAAAGFAATATATAAAPAATGSRRRRLWDLPAAAHCPVVGGCLPIDALRRLVAQCGGKRPAAGLADDHSLHCSAVADCRQRGPVAEALHRELDRRHALALRRAAQAKSTEALAAWWDAALGGSQQALGPLGMQGLAGALWATLTHPRCTPVLEDCVLGQMHMLQYQAGMASRVDLDRLEALLSENAVLGRALAAAQDRHQQLAAARQQQQDAAQAEAMRLHARLAAQDLQLAQQQAAQAALEAAVPGLQTRSALAAENRAQAERIQQLERQALQARHEAEHAQRMLAELAAQLQDLRQAGSAATPGQNGDGDTGQGLDAGAGAGTAADAIGPVRLDNHAVLCVGGRASAVPLYRLIIERSGARFIHHDGGTQDSSARLDATLAAADLVICQTGCVSHNAYWRVKDHCKRTGKRCVFVETPSTAGLKRALVQLAPAAAGRETTGAAEGGGAAA